MYNECTKLRMYDVNDKQRLVSASSWLKSLILLLNAEAKITIVVKGFPYNETTTYDLS